MKIEKVNDNQIRITLTREDLASRQIRLSELVYGTEKARDLFKDMIQQANSEVGFEVEDTPLMVEAIPLSTESIMLNISKVEYPEEMDVRFSNFSEPDASLGYDDPENSAPPVTQGADDILDLFKKMDEDVKDDSPKTIEPIADLTKMFELNNLDDARRLSKVIVNYYNGINDLYKDEREGKYYLLIHKSGHSPAEFNKICNRISEYALQKNYVPAIGAFFSEHGKLILADTAVQTLAQF